MVDLPIIFLESSNLLFKKGEISKIISTLQKIKTLAEFRLFGDNEYKLTPEEFKLFKVLPMTLVQLEALDLTAENIGEFRDIMRSMQLIMLEWDKRNFQDLDVELSLKTFGPNGSFLTI